MRARKYKFTAQDIANETGVDVSTVNRLIREGKLRADFVGDVAKFIIAKKLERECGIKL